MRGIKTYANKEGLVVFFLELLHRPIGALGIGEVLLLIIRNRSPLEKETATDFLSGVVGAGGEGIREGCFPAPRIHRPTGVALAGIA